MTEWWRGQLAGFDTETGGPDPLDARLVTASVVFTEPDQESVCTDWLVAVDDPIPAEATEIHKVTTEHAQQHGQPLETVVAEVSGLLGALWSDGCPLIVFNAPYDLTLLNQERSRCGAGPLTFTESSTPILDPLVIDRAMDKYRKGSRKLPAVCKHYGVTLDAAHTSAADSLAAVQVMRALVVAYPKLAQTSLQHLYRLQAVWYASWADNYQNYLRNKMASEDANSQEILDTVIDHSWPVRIPVEGPMRVGGRQR